MVHRQLTLFTSPPRDIAAALHGAAAAPASDSPRDPAVSAWLGRQLTDWASSHGWSRGTLGRARSGLRMLLAVQDTAGAPIPATWIEQLAPFHLPARLLHEFLAAHSFVDDDRTPAIESFSPAAADSPHLHPGLDASGRGTGPEHTPRRRHPRPRGPTGSSEEHEYILDEVRLRSSHLDLGGVPAPRLPGWTREPLAVPTAAVPGARGSCCRIVGVRPSARSSVQGPLSRAGSVGVAPGARTESR